MSTQGKIAIRCVRTLAGTPIIKAAVPEKASQTFLKGALVFIEAATGFLIECGADPASILGVATADGANNAVSGAVTQVVELAHPDNLFRGYLDTSAAEGAGTSAQTDLFKGYGVFKSASGVANWFVDKTDTTAKRTFIWEFWGETGYAVGDIRTHVIFSFMQANFQADIGT